MDRYIVREPRVGTECLQGNQIIAFPTSSAGNNMKRDSEEKVCVSRNKFDTVNGQFHRPETYFPPYGSEFPNIRPENRYPGLPQYAQANMMQGLQAQMMSGIDPTYLAAYSSSNAPYIAGHQQMHREMQMERQMQFHPDAFGNDYQNRNLMPVERNSCKTFAPKVVPCDATRHIEIETRPSLRNTNDAAKMKNQITAKPLQSPRVINVIPSKTNEIGIQKKESENQTLTRSEKLKALAKTGLRVFSGPIEKVLKWHKALQDIGVLVLFEIVAKCVSIRPGDSCSKNLVVRDDNGPAIQVVYYEIDFLLPELKPPCTVRVIGRMMPGTCRLQAFGVRPAAGDDVATLPRRAAVASHHVTKLCKEYGAASDKN